MPCTTLHSSRQAIFWFWENDLLMNSDKLEVCFFSTGQKPVRTSLPPYATVAVCLVTVSDKPMTIGIAFNGTETFEDCVGDIAKAYK